MNDMMKKTANLVIEIIKDNHYLPIALKISEILLEKMVLFILEDADTTQIHAVKTGINEMVSSLETKPKINSNIEPQETLKDAKTSPTDVLKADINEMVSSLETKPKINSNIEPQETLKGNFIELQKKIIQDLKVIFFTPYKGIIDFLNHTILQPLILLTILSTALSILLAITSITISLFSLSIIVLPFFISPNWGEVIPMARKLAKMTFVMTDMFIAANLLLTLTTISIVPILMGSAITGMLSTFCPTDENENAHQLNPM